MTVMASPHTRHRISPKQPALVCWVTRQCSAWGMCSQPAMPSLARGEFQMATKEDLGTHSTHLKQNYMQLTPHTILNSFPSFVYTNCNESVNTWGLERGWCWSKWSQTHRSCVTSVHGRSCVTSVHGRFVLIRPCSGPVLFLSSKQTTVGPQSCKIFEPDYYVIVGKLDLKSDLALQSSVQFSSGWYLWAREDQCALHPISQELSPMLPLKEFPMLVWLTMALKFLILSRKIIEHFLFLRLSPSGDRWCDVLGFVPADCVTSSSTLQIFRDASCLWWLL